MRNCELLWEYYKICDALGDFCGFADVVSTVETINQTEGADSIENALERRGMAVGGLQEGGRTIDGRSRGCVEGAWR